jgi:two-component system NtrC family sensor kinase
VKINRWRSWTVVAVSAIVLATTLTLLYVRSKAHDSTAFFENIVVLRQLKELDSLWELDVLKSRMGISQNYDSLVDPLVQLNLLSEGLQSDLNAQQQQFGRASPGSLVAAFRTAIEAKTRLVEHFKSHNSVLRNSLAFLPIAAQDIEQAMGSPLNDTAQRKEFRSGMNKILMDALVFSQTPSDERAAAIAAELAGLSGHQGDLSLSARAGLEIFESHVRVVISEQPKVNDLLRAIAAVPTATTIDAIDNAISVRQRDAEFTAQQYRRYLLFFAAILAALVMYSGIGLIRGHAVINRVNRELQSVNASLEERVEERTRELHDAQSALVTSARRAGMADIAKNVLHNVGNVLNSVNVSVGLIDDKMRDSKFQGLARAVELMNEHATDLGDFLNRDEKGRAVLPYMNKLVARLRLERASISEELAALTKGVGHIKEIVATQQSLSRARGVIEAVSVVDLLEDALRTNAPTMLLHRIVVVRECSEVPLLLLDRHLLLQILINLIANAGHAMAAEPKGLHQLTLKVDIAELAGGRRLRIQVKDDGEGVAAENLARLFSHGFTTRSTGHGFGLHSCALAAKQMSGTISAHSEGPGRGATFTLELPVNPAEVCSEHTTEPARLAG